MLVHKLQHNDFDESNFQLIAIHTSLEDYKLAYFINKKLSISLVYNSNEISISSKGIESKFSRFLYDDQENEISWNLIHNKSFLVNQESQKSQNLFSDLNVDFTSKFFLLPEFKKVDYFLKIDNVTDDLPFKNVYTQLNSIENITTSYEIETNKIKSKNNLIF